MAGRRGTTPGLAATGLGLHYSGTGNTRQRSTGRRRERGQAKKGKGTRHEKSNCLAN